MQSSLRLEAVTDLFEPYVRELRSLFTECGIPYGSAADLPGFAEAIAAKGPLRSGVRLTVRSILRQAPEPLSHGELVEMILAAVGGTDVDEDAPAAQKTERVLSLLVGEAMTAPALLTLIAPEKDKAAGFSSNPDPISFTDEENELLQDQAFPETRTGPETMRWASPPAFVWIALLCGALLAPSMYFLSRPHAVAPVPAQAAAASPRHSVVEPAPPKALDSTAFDQLLSDINAAGRAPRSSKSAARARGPKPAGAPTPKSVVPQVPASGTATGGSPRAAADALAPEKNAPAPEGNLDPGTAAPDSQQPHTP